MSDIKVKAKEVLERAERIPYNSEWTLLEQNQLQAAKDLAKAVLGGRNALRDAARALLDAVIEGDAGREEMTALEKLL